MYLLDRARLLKAGVVSLIAGLVVTVIGSQRLNDVWTDGDLYWVGVINSVGVALIVTGIVIFIVRYVIIDRA